MNYGEFKTWVSENIRKGDTLDSEIPRYVQRAGYWLETNYTYQYMRRFVTWTQDAGAAEPRVVSFPSRLKSIRFIRYAETDGDYIYLKLIDPRSVSKNEDKLPTAYWLDAMEHIWFDNAVQTDQVFEMSYPQFTDWESLGDSAEPWPFIHGADVLLAKTMELIAPRAREPDWMGFYGPMLAQGLSTMLRADEDLQHDNEEAIMNIPTDG